MPGANRKGADAAPEVGVELAGVIDGPKDTPGVPLRVGNLQRPSIADRKRLRKDRRKVRFARDESARICMEEIVKAA